jgi:Family of unknown function (DUF6519)
MKADLSRDTFEPARHFLRVLQQQGRVQIDADANEQASILLHHLHTLARDLIGPAGGPEGAGLGFELELDGSDLLIGPGRYYVDGILCEAELPPPPDEGPAPTGISYFAQPDYAVDPDDELPDGTFLAYLDTWERHVTSIDDGRIREVALGGPDTATRSKVVWQVKLTDRAPNGRPLTLTTRAELETHWQALVESLRPRDAGGLAAGTGDPEEDTDPCITPPAAGYRGAENQLYRVEIVDSGSIDVATFVWSRENGSVLSGWDQSGNRLTFTDPGRDRKLGFEPGHWVELTDDVRELLGKPGTFVQVTRVEEAVLTVDGDTATGPLDPDSFDVNPKIRRWDSDGPQTVEVPSVRNGWIPLEDGVEVRFASEGTYQTGDYWLIPARVLGGVEWPTLDGEPSVRPPHGIEHHFAPLALFVAAGGGGRTFVDCRYQFPAASSPVVP